MSAPSQSSNTNTSLTVVGCSCAALVISFLGLARFDLPITKYVRSVTIHLPWDQLTIPWMAFTSNMGDWIGQGWRLTALSILLLAIAWTFEKPTIKSAAIQTLIAHGIAALLANGLKHLIGRPRPKFVHAGDWQISLSLASGLDSFPSGHSTASFAIATVLAKRFPVIGPFCITVAIFVGISRVLRGSHFPTDVIGGAAIGILSGFLATAPLRHWRTSLQEGLRLAAIAVSSVFGLLWTLSHQMEGGITGVAYVALGAVSIASGLWSRRGYWLNGERSELNKPQATASALLIAYGLAAMTTSPLVLSSVGFVCLASWFGIAEQRREEDEPITERSVMRESALIGSLVLAVLILLDARGVLPFQ